MDEAKGLFTEFEFQEFVKNGAGFKRIYDQYIGLIQYIAAKYLSRQSEVDDVVQEAFLRLYRDRAKVEKQTALKAWLAVTTRNLAIDHLRRQRHDVVALEDVAEPVSGDERKAVVVELSIEIVRTVLTELAAKGEARELKLFYLDGMKAVDIAKQMNLSVSAVTTNLTRQRRKYGEILRAKLEEIEEQEKLP